MLFYIPNADFSDKQAAQTFVKDLAKCLSESGDFAPYKVMDYSSTSWVLDQNNDWRAVFFPDKPTLVDIFCRYKSQEEEVPALIAWLKRNYDANPVKAKEGQSPEPEPQPQASAGYEAAVATLRALGYTYHGGEQWKPPLGKLTMRAAGSESADLGPLWVQARQQHPHNEDYPNSAFYGALEVFAKSVIQQSRTEVDWSQAGKLIEVVTDPRVRQHTTGTSNWAAAVCKLMAEVEKPARPAQQLWTDDEIIDTANEVHRAMPEGADEQDELLAIIRELESKLPQAATAAVPASAATSVGCQEQLSFITAELKTLNSRLAEALYRGTPIKVAKA